jgi:cytochrome b pre-mRNA-processing protein 3
MDANKPDAERPGGRGPRGGIWPFRRSPQPAYAALIMDTVTRVSRQPGFFGPDRVPDTLEGRMEMVFLHAGLLLMRLKGEAGRLSQAFTNRLFTSLEDGLREAGVGDLAVPRRMHKIAGAFYGRLGAYEPALRAGDRAALAAALARNVFAATAADAPFALVLARHTAETAASLAATPLAELDRLEAWRPAPA